MFIDDILGTITIISSRVKSNSNNNNGINQSSRSPGINQINSGLNQQQQQRHQSRKQLTYEQIPLQHAVDGEGDAVVARVRPREVPSSSAKGRRWRRHLLSVSPPLLPRRGSVSQPFRRPGVALWVRGAGGGGEGEGGVS